ARSRRIASGWSKRDFARLAEAAMVGRYGMTIVAKLVKSVAGRRARLLELTTDKFKQRLGWLVIRQAKLGIDRAVRLSFCRDDRHADTCSLQCLGKAL